MWRKQDLLRLKTKPGATRYSFLADDATGFPQALPPAVKIGLKQELPADFISQNSPVRKIPFGRRALTGQQPTKKAQHSGHFESALERDLYIQLEFDPIVQSWHPQPICLDVPNEVEPYHPDVAVEYLAYESRRANAPLWMLYEVKYTSDLKKHWNQLRPRFKAALKFAKHREWGFKILTERDIRSEYLFNAKFLLPYLRHPEAQGWSVVLDVVRKFRKTTPRQIVEVISSDKWLQAEYLTHVWTLVARRDIRCDLFSKISMNAPVWIE